jgi:hypothetical protein
VYGANATAPLPHPHPSHNLTTADGYTARAFIGGLAWAFHFYGQVGIATLLAQVCLLRHMYAQMG